MKSSFFLLILLLTIQGVFSQTIIGHVLDGQTREPLMGVSVYFDGTTIGSITNEKGAFK
ncbi:MAG: carboxypeptidase-like regulatory domain-containing protein, partial [Mangrovimonas sp.]|nr:carboxypeptidase-like regulatory domain-containing protein [Mangrovimonas sp.]